ncbi:MAG: hypothetical protein PHT99_08670 [Methanoregula sp.]|nr:hypothetical protein [Methanoregula sp.]
MTPTETRRVRLAIRKCRTGAGGIYTNEVMAISGVGREKLTTYLKGSGWEKYGGHSSRYWREVPAINICENAEGGRGMKHDRNEILETAYSNEVAIEYSQAIFEEMAFASSKFPAFASEHEGYAILLEEVDELWEAVKLNQKSPERAKQIEKECIQVGAMALRFLHDMKKRGGGAP